DEGHHHYDYPQAEPMLNLPQPMPSEHHYPPAPPATAAVAAAGPGAAATAGGGNAPIGSSYYDYPHRPLPTPTPASMQELRIAAPSPHPVPLMEARPYTPNENPTLADMAKQEEANALNAQHLSPVRDEKLDPRVMPHIDDYTNSLINIENAPPEGARRREEYDIQRRRQLKQVTLTSGNLVLDCRVPSKVLDMGRPEYRMHPECTHMRYTACTCDPNYFVNNRYMLRPALYTRQTELFIVLTMYNEDDKLFNRTFIGVMKNIRYLCARTRSKTWGEDAWKKVVVCIVSDGRAKIHPRVRTVLGCMGVYQEGIMQNTVNGKDVEAHIFEYTVQFCINEKGEFVGHEKKYPPVQVIFCLKEKNAKKINSHRWFFNAFSNLLKPKVCVLIDVGTKPAYDSIYHLWKAFDKNPKVAGACGEICADLGKGCCSVWNPLIAAQNFEYKISNILDKPLESVFGYISVLPGAFSAYRYAALQDINDHEGPLYSYFKGELIHAGKTDNSKKKSGGIFEANMYLAEDRILCFELVAKKHCKYLLRYVKSSKAYTDVPDTLSELISQRRRWLNGSFFATFYALVHWYKMFGTRHNPIRLLMLCLEFLYQVISMIFSWFTLGNFYLTYYFIEQNITRTWNEHGHRNADPFHGAGHIVLYIFRMLYIVALMTQFVLSLGNRPQGTRFIYTATVVLFTIIMLVLTYSIIYSIVYAIHKADLNNPGELVHQEYFRDIVISVAATYGLYFVSSLLYFEPWHMFTSFIQYMLWLPSSINILMVYAFCNIHDVSWGTKGDNAASSDQGHAKLEKRKDGTEVAHVQVATEQDAIDANYEAFLREFRTKPVVAPPKVDVSQAQEDLNKKIRTYTLLGWMISNVVLVMVISGDWFANEVAKLSKDSDQVFNPYLSFIFWSVAGLSAFRFIGSVVYIVLHWLGFN
ncbi:hypothetical protein EV182_000584, partial [Spiromyces aspiralis]